MIYIDLSPVIEAYMRGENITIKLREMLGLPENSPQLVEIVYDLQAGTYTKNVEDNPSGWKDYCNELASILSSLPNLGSRILDVGTGEMTVLTGIANGLSWADKELFACDISLSRLLVGNKFMSEHWKGKRVERITSFVGDMFKLPFKDNSIDLVWTSHAVEPNGGKELTVLSELFRVSRNYVVLFEPSFENNTGEGQLRMQRLGYVKGLPEAIHLAGGELIDCLKIQSAAEFLKSPLNPTWGYICRKKLPCVSAPSDSFWACPATRLDLFRRDGHFFSPYSRIAYPIIKEIPILRAEAGILASLLY